MSEDLRQALIGLAMAAILALVISFTDKQSPEDEDGGEGQYFDEDEFD